VQDKNLPARKSPGGIRARNIYEAKISPGL
jgi:hypothetical protein